MPGGLIPRPLESRLMANHQSWQGALHPRHLRVGTRSGTHGFEQGEEATTALVTKTPRPLFERARARAFPNRTSGHARDLSLEVASIHQHWRAPHDLLRPLRCHRPTPPSGIPKALTSLKPEALCCLGIIGELRLTFTIYFSFGL